MAAEREISCPECRVPMEPGCIPDLAPLAAYIPGWVESEAVQSAGGLLAWMQGGLGSRTIQFPRSRQFLPVVTYRCPQCGLLREYAREKQANGERCER